MKYLTRTTFALLATVSLAGCGSSNGGNNTAAQSDMNAGTTDNMTAASSNPFADAEAKMNQAMMAAVGSDVGQTWARKMIAHHQGAIDMSQVVLAQNPSADVAKMARESTDKQQKDIASIQKLLKEGPPDQKSAELYKPAMMDMKQKMDPVSGSDINQVFMRKMLEHHRGAVAMSDVALKNGVTGALRQQIEKTRSENQKDAEMVEAMLRGEPMQHAKSDAAASMSNSGTAAKRPEHEAHDMNAMGNMDMNHM